MKYLNEVVVPERVIDFIKTSVLGGVAFLLPMAVLFVAARWVFSIVVGLVSPVTHVILSKSSLSFFVADIVSLLLLAVACFFLGVFLKTKAGGLVLSLLENKVLSITPGYSFVKETVGHFFNKNKSPFKRPVIISLSPGLDMLGFVTDELNDGRYAVLCPTAPNVTSGIVLIVEKDKVTNLDVPSDVVMKSVVGCGVGFNRFLGVEKND